MVRRVEVVGDATVVRAAERHRHAHAYAPLAASPDALRGVIDVFVTREGTDDGVHTVPLATTVRQGRHHLDVGTLVIVNDEGPGSWTIQPADQLSDEPSPPAPLGAWSPRVSMSPWQRWAHG